MSDIVENSHTKPFRVHNAQELIALTSSGQLEDTLYIGDRNYRSEFTLKTKEEIEALPKDHKTKVSHKNIKSDFFVYNERTGETTPFQKNSYLIYDRGYFTFDGEQYISCDDNGDEIQKFSFK
jgi:hypothetical protein